MWRQSSLWLFAWLICFSVGSSQAGDNDYFRAGSTLLSDADALDQQARQLIQSGNDLRQSIKKSRQKLLNLPVGERRTRAAAELQVAIDESLGAQKEGAALRKQAGRFREQALEQFAQGLQHRWPDWVANPDPIQLSDGFSDVPRLDGHNVRTRSVHPSKQQLAGTPETEQGRNMSLALPRLSAQQLPPELNTDSFAFSRERRFVGHIEVLASSVNSVDGQLEINELHQWVLVLSDLEGQPVSGIDVQFTGHMPGHVHGLPTQPRITEELAPGVYKISGVKFQMRGWWVIEFRLSSGAESAGDIDSLRFNLHL